MRLMSLNLYKGIEREVVLSYIASQANALDMLCFQEARFNQYLSIFK